MSHNFLNQCCVFLLAFTKSKFDLSPFRENLCFSFLHYSPLLYSEAIPKQTFCSVNQFDEINKKEIIGKESFRLF